MAKGSFLINPLIANNGDLFYWYLRFPLTKITGFRVYLESAHEYIFFKNEIKFNVKSFDVNLPSLSEKVSASLFNSLFNSNVDP